jgi:Na+-driven multidrug efflux pump
MMVLIAVAFTVPLFAFTKKLFVLVGAGKTVGMSVAYGQVIFAGSIFIFFTNIADVILRGEGDARRAMYAMALGAGLNIVLDPIFIYTFGLGIAGAAWATVLSLGITSVIMLNWLLITPTYHSHSAISNVIRALSRTSSGLVCLPCVSDAAFHGIHDADDECHNSNGGWH